ncbi:hypothetical protein PFISCL1PPCAC_7092, partial [Pristionchus fissidentatus]
DKWRMSDGSVSAGKMECKPQSTGSKTPAWIWTGGGEQKALACSDKFVCSEFSKLSKADSIVTVNSTSLACKDNKKIIQVIGGTEPTSPSLKCDSTDGLYKMADGQSVPREAKLKCI